MKSKGLAGFLVTLLSCTAAHDVGAQNYVVDAQLSGQLSGGLYHYTLTLNNESSSMMPVGTFWFAWTDSGYDLLISKPMVTQTPTGWSGSVLGGPYSYYGYTYYDGYSIQFTSTGATLSPGSALSFQFTSPDSPLTMSGVNPNFGSAIETSVVYSGGPYSDAGDQFLVQTVPEPSVLGLLSLAGATMAMRFRRRRA
jgi:hypothetical protein